MGSEYESADSLVNCELNMPTYAIRKLKASIEQCKTSIGRAERSFGRSRDHTIEDIQVRKQNLKEIYARYEELSSELHAQSEHVKGAVAGEAGEGDNADADDEIEDDEDEESIEERYLALLSLMESRLKQKTPPAAPEKRQSETSCSTRIANLPPLDVPNFDGRDVANYKPFIEMFQAVVAQDPGLSDIQKLCFLKKYLKGEALHIIDNMPIVGESYAPALKLLQKRYDNPALLTNSHVTGLLDLPSLHRGSAQQLREFVVTVRQHVTALKNLEQPVSQWNAILSCVLLRKLDPLTVRLFHSDRDTTKIVNIDGLLAYLDKRAASLEASPTVSEKSQNKPVSKSVNLATVNKQIQKQCCSFCSKEHKLFKCPEYIALNPEKRYDFVTKNKLCKVCLTSHIQKCRYNFKCNVCNSSNHNTLIHVKEDQPGPKAQEGENEKQVNLHIAQPVNECVLLPTAKVLVTGNNNKKYIVRALCDCGSQTSFCTASFANQLGLPQIDMQKNIGTLGDICNSRANKGINLTINSLVHDFQINITCSVINKITSRLPQKQIDLSNFVIPKNIALADTEFHIPGEISLLLASDVFFKIIQDGKIEGGPADPILINTRLGYIVSSTSQSNSNTTIAMHTVNEPDLDHCVRQFWEAERVPDVYHESLSEHEYSERVFKDSVSLQNNTFQVKFPLKVELQDVDPSNSYAIALQRLYNLEKRFTKDPVYHDLYKKFIHEYLDLGHAKIIDTKNSNSQNEPLFFLPHHAVLRPDKQTNKLRVVFDGSAKTSSGLSLNDIMCKGPVVQRSLFDIIMQFRTYKYTLQCDIRHMYRMIQVHPDFKRLQNILWRENGVMSILQLQTITYGLTCSSFLATRCLLELAHMYKEEYPLASSAIIKNSFVDDIETGHDTLQGATQLKNELIALMKLANFNLHKWVSNSSELLNDLPQTSLGVGCKNIDQDDSVVKILGLCYDSNADEFQLSGRVITPTETPTKRSVLSSISRLFDPMGFAGPVTMKAKLIMQELWQNSLEWDTPLPSELAKIWQLFYTNLVSMPTIRVPRYIQIADADEVQIVGFSDSSAKAYGCCIYLKVKVKGITHIHLLCSKSRLAAINTKLTIPKLELNGALLLAMLVSIVASTLQIADVHLFCDSKVVLGWLNASDVKVPAYIGNRVREINKLTPGMFWHFTPGLFNPADILSRGCDPHELADHGLWQHGPDYLQDSDNYNLYLSEIERPFQTYNDESEPALCLTVVNNEPIHPLFEKYSSLFKTTIVMAYILRFINRCKKCDTQTGKISLAEFRAALYMIIKGVQLYYFADEFKCIADKRPIKGQLCRLCPFADDKGILRVTGRLQNADLDFSKKFPIILPKHCHVTTLIIRQEHLSMLHGGLKLVLGSLFQKYYIINSVREVKSVIFKCISCSRQKAQAAEQIMGALPKSRVTPARAFERVGLDYCGPFDIKQSSKHNSIITKGYVALFICFACKAIHLEVVSDMSTDTFMAAFKRFVSRRGVPTDVYSDNASTFKGANNQLKELYTLHRNEEFQNMMHSYALQRQIHFHFIPAYSPNHGGLWEAGVKSAKFHLKRISSCKVFTYEQFNTIMIEIESVLNSRPLTSITNEDHSDFSYLTPGHFLIGCPLTAIPQHDLTEIPTNRLHFWRSCEQVKQHFWKVWSKDYLSALNTRTKWHKVLPNLKEGAVVLLINQNTPPLHWPLGRITKTICGNDQKVRVVEVQTSNGKLHSRAVSKIVVLPVD